MNTTINKWTDDEKTYVISKFKSGKSIEDIANSGKIKRSRYAIELKAYNSVYDLLQSGMTHDEVATEYNRSKKEIIEIEKKIFEMKQNDKSKIDTNTPYYNDGGYKYNESNISSSVIDFNDIHHFNRTMHVVLNFYENIDRLNTLKKNKIIDDEFYNDLIKKTNDFAIDKNKILSALSDKGDKATKSEKSEKSEKSDKNKLKPVKVKKSDTESETDEEKSFKKNEEKSFKKNEEKSFKKDEEKSFKKNEEKSFKKDEEKSFKKDEEKSFKKSFKNEQDDDGKYDEVPKKLKKRLL